MPLVSMRQVLDHAAENGYGVPAFNVNDMEQIHAILQAAAETDSPAILQASAGARQYAGEPFLRHLALAAVEAWPTVPIARSRNDRRRCRYFSNPEFIGFFLVSPGRAGWDGFSKRRAAAGDR